MGRPTKRTEERRGRLLTALQDGNTRRASCALAGISEDTLARWIASSADFADAIQKAEAEAEEQMVLAVRGASRESWQAAAWWLERKRPEDWARKESVTVLQKAVKELDKLSNDELLALALGDGDSSEGSVSIAGTPGGAGSNGNGKH